MNLNQVTIHTDKTIETAGFFQKLGLQLIVDSLPRYARLLCPDGESTLSVEHSDTAAKNSSITLYFECDDLDARVTELKAAGLEFIEEPADQSWLWRESYLLDPNGNRICLFHAGENRKDPPWRVS